MKAITLRRSELARVRVLQLRCSELARVRVLHVLHVNS